MSRNYYAHPHLGLVNERVARARLMSLANKLDKQEQHARAHFIRSNWQRTAARPSLWRELSEFSDSLVRETNP